MVVIFFSANGYLTPDQAQHSARTLCHFPDAYARKIPINQSGAFPIDFKRGFYVPYEEFRIRGEGWLGTILFDSSSQFPSHPGSVDFKLETWVARSWHLGHEYFIM